jgi:hypothetical protein
MLRLFSVLILCSSAMAVAGEPAVQPAATTSTATPAEAAEAAPAVEAAEATEAVEEPQMKKVCHSEDVVGSAIPRRVCKMKPVRKPNG